MKKIIVFILLLLTISRTIYAQHVVQPPVNLGLTNFLDGQAFPGLLVEQYVDYYDAYKFNDNDGNKIPGKNKLNSLSFVTHLAYITHKKLLGGYVGFEAVVPIVYLDINQAKGQKGDKTAFGDITISPLLLQWRNNLFDRPYFHRFAFSVILPTGNYDRKDDINIGSNIYSLNPYYSFTYFLTPKLSISSRIHYLWNSDNEKPMEMYNANNITPGQSIHFNYATSLEIFNNFRLGLAGYYLKQISPSQIDGNSQINSEEEVFSFGPGCHLMTKNRLQLHFNYYHEFFSKNRPLGDKFVLRLSRAF
jgi:hypothetical protein